MSDLPEPLNEEPGAATVARDMLRIFALGLPGAYEEFPWGESVVKVNKKVFVFLGMAPAVTLGCPSVSNCRFRATMCCRCPSPSLLATA